MNWYKTIRHYYKISSLKIIMQYIGWLLSSFPSLIRHKISCTQTILVIMVFRVVIQIFSMILKDFSSLRPRAVFCMESFVEKICVLARRKIRESGPTAFQIIFLESSNSRTN